MRLPNLLATRRGRLTGFFLLYLTEGLPIGFATTAVATLLRRDGVGTAEIGAFLGLALLPWAFKWAYGPFVDLIGTRRGWILAAQALMALTLLALPGLSLPGQLGLFTAVLVLHNLFGALQDVAVDALAVTHLQEGERAFASGLMFGGQSLGVLIGGGGALLLSGRIGFAACIGVLVGLIVAVMVLVVLPMREAAREQRSAGLSGAGAEVLAFLRQAASALFGSRLALAALLFGVLPTAATALSRGLQANMAVDLGLGNAQIGGLATASQAATALACVLGGWLSDRLPLRRALAVYMLLASLPGLWLMVEMQRHGWAAGQAAPAALVSAFYAASVAYHLAYGFIYGARVAVFLGITQPAVAATQFAAYMAMSNLSIAYAAAWQGHAVQRWGYATTLGLDTLIGLAGLLVLPLLRPRAMR